MPMRIKEMTIMLKPGDRVRILYGQNKGKTGVYLYTYRDRAVVQYGPKSYHRTRCKPENLEKVGETQ